MDLRRHKKSVYPNGARALVLFAAVVGIMSAEVADAESAVRIALIAQKSSLAPQRKGLVTGLSESLKDALNRYQRKYFQADVVSLTEYGNYASMHQKCMAGPPGGDVAQCPQPYGYYVLLDVTESNAGLYKATVTLLSADHRELYRFEEKEEKDVQNPLVHPIMNQLIIALTKNIRIVMYDFFMLGGKETYGQLKRTLPNMLAEGLALSGGMVLIEPLAGTLRDEYARAADKGSAVYAQSTAIQLSKRIHANYVIVGEYGELAEGLRIDARCVNLETGEIVAKRGTTVSPITWGNIEKEIAIVAADMRSAIVDDFTVSAQRPRYLALTGVPPVPNTEENRATLLEIIRTASRKLQLVELQGVRLREDLDAVSRFLVKKHDPWLMSSELEADVLLSFHLDRTERDRLYLAAERFDLQSPRESERLPECASPEDVGERLDDLIKSMRDKKWVQIRGDLAKLKEVEYHGLYKPLAFQFHAGPSIRTDPKLFLDSEAGLLVDFGIVLNPAKSMRWQFEVLRLRFDFWGSRANGDKIVIGSDILFGANFRFRPHYEKSVVVGASVGYLGVIRDAPSESSSDGVLGAGLSASIEQTLTSSRKVTYRAEYTKAFDRIPERTLGEEVFNGGRPGGIYFTIGTEF